MAFKHRKGMTEERRHRAARALAYRRDGDSYPTIAQKLDVSVTTAYDDVQKALQEITREPAEEVLTLELSRLDTMHARLAASIRQILNSEDGEGISLPSIEQIRKLIGTQLNVSERRAKLLGLEVQRQEVTFDSADAIVEQLGTILTTPVEDLVGMVEGDTPEEA